MTSCLFESVVAKTELNSIISIALGCDDTPPLWFGIGLPTNVPMLRCFLSTAMCTMLTSHKWDCLSVNTSRFGLPYNPHYSACFSSQNSVFLSQQFSQNSVFQPKFQQAERAQFSQFSQNSALENIFPLFQCLCSEINYVSRVLL